MLRSTLVAAMVVFFGAIAYSTVESTEVKHATRSSCEQKSVLSYLKPGQRVMHTRFEGGLVRLEVVTDELLAAAKRKDNSSSDEWPAVKEVTSEFVVLQWNTEERTATQILPRSSILEVWLENNAE